MIDIPDRSQPPTIIRCVSGTLLSLVLLLSRRFSPRRTWEELSGGTKPVHLRRNPSRCRTAKRLGIKLNQLIVSNWLGIKTTGQIFPTNKWK